MTTWNEALGAEGHPLSPGSSLRTTYTNDSAPPSPEALEDDAERWMDNEARPLGQDLIDVIVIS